MNTEPVTILYILLVAMMIQIQRCNA